MIILDLNTPIKATKANEISNYRDFCYPNNNRKEIQNFNNEIRLYNYYPVLTNEDEVRESRARLKGRTGLVTALKYSYKLVDIKFIKTFTYYNASYINPPQIKVHLIEYKGVNYIAVQVERENRYDYGITMDTVKQYLYVDNVPISNKKFLMDNYPTQYNITVVGDGTFHKVAKRYDELIKSIKNHPDYMA